MQFDTLVPRRLTAPEKVFLDEQWFGRPRVRPPEPVKTRAAKPERVRLWAAPGPVTLTCPACETAFALPAWAVAQRTARRPGTRPCCSTECARRWRRRLAREVA